MKLFFIADELFPVRGAPAVRVRNLMQNFPEATAIGGNLDGSAAPENYTTLPRPPERSMLRFVAFLLRLGFTALRKAMREKPEVIVLSVPKYEMLLFAPVLSRRCKLFVLDVRDSFAFLDYAAYLRHFLPNFLAQPLGAILKCSIGFLQHRAIRSAHIVTTANKGIAQSIKHPRVFVVPNGVDTELFHPQSRARRSLPLRLVYLGNFAEKDRFDWILSASELCADIEVHLIGDGRNKPHVISEFRSAGIAVKDHGIVPHDSLPQVLGTMDLGFIFRKPGVDESIPVCLYEFIAMGVPAVCNDTGLMASFIREHHVGWVVQSAGDFRKLLGDLQQDLNILQQFDGIETLAQQQFSLKASAKRFLDVVHEASV